MTYVGQVKDGVVVFDGEQRPPDGVLVRVEALPTSDDLPVGEGLDRLAGTAQGLPPDLAERHDEHRRARLAK